MSPMAPQLKKYLRRFAIAAFLLALALGGVAAGGPVLGWVADRFGPRWALASASATAFMAAGVGLVEPRRGPEGAGSVDLGPSQPRP